MEQIKTDLCIIGGGSGGLSIAAGAVQMGASVVLVEGHKMGGDCLNYGCVPSKALIAAAKAAHNITSAGKFGINATVNAVDYAAAQSHVAKVIATIEPHDSVERFTGLGVRVIEAFGEFLNETTLRAGTVEITARRFVIATGSTAFVPPVPGLETVPYLTNETLWDLRDLPEHLIVVGGGPIGMEMAQAHRRLGAKVTVLEGATALGKDDPELAAIALENLRAEGIDIQENALVSQISGKAGDITVQTQDGASYTGTHLLMAVGRKPNIDKLNLDKAGVKTNRAGVVTDARLKSTNRRIYAVGDVAGGLQFTHVAGYHAGIVIRSALFGLPAKAKTNHIPWATYTDPEIAQVGLTEAEARAKHGDKLTVTRFSFGENDRALAEAKPIGLIKVMVVKSRPVGVSIVGPQAGELIGLWAMAIVNRLKMGQIAATVLPYPTLSEVSKRAAGAYFSPALFDNPRLKRIVGLVQRFLP